MPAEYRFLLADLLTDDIIGELPVEAATYGEVLNAPGRLTASIRLGETVLAAADPPDYGIEAAHRGDWDGTGGAPDPSWSGQAGAYWIATATGTIGGQHYSSGDRIYAVGGSGADTTWQVWSAPTASTAPDVQPGRHALYVERDSVLIWGGPIWTYEADVATNSGTIGAEGFFSLVRGRLLETAYSVTARDQALIAVDILDEVQGYTEGDMLLDTSTIQSTGKLRNRSWAAEELKDVGEAIEQLAAVRDGFDFRVGVRWGATKPVREVFTAYPATGRATNYVLELGRNLELLSLTVDATTVANKVHGLGEEDDDAVRLETSTHNTGTGLFRRDAVTVHSDVSELATLTDHVQRRLDRGGAPMRIPHVAIYPEQEPSLGSFIVGDIMTVRGIFGAVDFGGSYRITGWTASIDQSGNERVELTLAPLEVFA